uniref:Uncharacterized protein n=1 Tax=Pipistrellus kuhlii TaxID=59472 RepID=A0A7J7WD62_PIPKU|nr:hypothetical protein mPipKuh1_008048 [Pipistrellus kuhlii]
MQPLSWCLVLLSVGEAVGLLDLSDFNVHSSHLEILLKRSVGQRLGAGPAFPTSSQLLLTLLHHTLSNKVLSVVPPALFFNCTHLVFKLNLLGTQWFIKLHRLRVYNSIIHHLHILPSLQPPSPLLTTILLSVSMCFCLFVLFVHLLLSHMNEII